MIPQPAAVAIRQLPFPRALRFAILLATLTPQGVTEFEFLPVSIVNARPFMATGAAADRIREQLSGITNYGIFE